MIHGARIWTDNRHGCAILLPPCEVKIALALAIEVCKRAGACVLDMPGHAARTYRNAGGKPRRLYLG